MPIDYARYLTMTPDEEWEYLKNWHWDPSKLEKQVPRPAPQPVSVLDKRAKTENWEERMMRMLYPLARVTRSCSMCSLGKKACVDHDTIFDPHVFSNMKPSKWVVVGQNPGFNEALQGEPFVGDSGKIFARELRKHDMWRSDFYITNALKCYTVGNAKPTFEELATCEPILRMELQLLRPVLVVTLGTPAFDTLCPDLVMGDHLGSIVESKKFGVMVYAIYHPSPRNQNIPERKAKFIEDVRNLCELIKAYRTKHPELVRKAPTANTGEGGEAG